MTQPCLIVEVSEASQWAPFRGCKKLPQERMPTVLHPSRDIAEQEALRLQQAHPGRLFAVFAAVTAATSVKVPTHITLGGQIVAERQMPTLVEIDEDLIPF